MEDVLIGGGAAVVAVAVLVLIFWLMRKDIVAGLMRDKDL